MFNRRRFLSKSVLASVAGVLGLSACENKAPEIPTPQFGLKHNQNSQSGIPMVISTWDNIPANEAAIKAIQSGNNALDAVEAGVKVVEADPNNRTVGYGGAPDREGVVTLDACIMDDKGNAGSVSFLQNIKHPISVARKVMEKTPHVMLVGAGALQFAKEEGFMEENLLTDSSQYHYQKWLQTAQYKPQVNVERHDTIGMLAIDQQGNLSGACTTSGMAYKMHGRVGDSPIIGAGLYVDEVGAACATGVGELVLKTLGSFLVVELMRQGRTPQEACEEAVKRISERYRKYVGEDFQVGFVAANKKGEHGAYSILNGFIYTLSQMGKVTVYDSGFIRKG